MPPSQPSSSFSPSVSLATSARPARSSARDRRTATRMSWRLSGSVPSRVPGSCARIAVSWSSSSARSASNGSFGAGCRPGRPSARKSFGMPSPRVAPARPTSFAIASSAFGSPERSSISTSTNSSATRMRVHHRDLVDGDLGSRAVARDELAAAARPQLRDRRDRTVAEMRREQRLHLLRRLGRPARLLQLEAEAVRRQLQLPDAAAALGAPAERDPRARERVAGHVVVDGREHARLERAAAQRGELEAVRRLELALMLGSDVHRRAHDSHAPRESPRVT